MKQALYVWIFLMSLITFVAFGVDKKRAVRNQYRISEKALITISLIGGGIGGWLGMRVFHHKTRHWYFLYGMPLIFVLQIALIIFLIKGPIQIITL